jgi:hypothetical protein
MKLRRLVESHLRVGRPVAELAVAHVVHRSWIYKASGPGARPVSS